MRTVNLKGYLTINETRGILGRNGKPISRQRIHKLIQKKKILADRPASRVTLIKKKSVEDYLKDREKDLGSR